MCVRILFDLVLSMFTSFGYFDDKGEDVTVLENIFTSLRPGGAFLIDVLGKERLAKILQPTISTSLPDGSILARETRFLMIGLVCETKWLLIRDGKTRSFKFLHHTIYSGLELRERMERARFVGVTIHGNLDGAEYGPNAERLIAPRPQTSSALARNHLHLCRLVRSHFRECLRCIPCVISTFISIFFPRVAMHKTIIEPFRIKSVEPLHRTTPEERRLLEQAGYNLFSISSDFILIDLADGFGHCRDVHRAMGRDDAWR